MAQPVTSAATPDPLDRARALARFRDEQFDIAIIGGGVNGAAVARDAAMRGLRVALVDRGDFAGGTSSRSSKLIHGGFRYLPQGQLKLVFEALRERERMRRRTAPHLVRPIRFLFPVYRGRGFSRFVMSMGLWMYDLLAMMPRSEWHQNLSAARVREMEPMLAREGLTGGALYYDGWGDDARITFENLLDAAIHGAAVANYAEVEGFINRDGRICAATIRDLTGEGRVELRARMFVNATGPWVDHIRRLDDPACVPSVRLTKGVHLVFARTTMPVRDSLVLADEAGRIVFVMPHDRYVLVGTTDTDYTGDPAAVTADRDDVAYLLGVLAESLPGIRLTAEDVASSFAGLRALVVSGDPQAPSSVPREEVILESPTGMLTVAGGKLTTHREIAEKLVNRVIKDLGLPAKNCPTRDAPLPGARAPDGADSSRDDAETLAALPRASREILIARYGTRAYIPARIAAAHSALAACIAPGCPVIAAEAIYAVRHEMVLTLADFMVRRTAMVWRYPAEAEIAAPVVAQLMASELGWNAERQAREVAEFRADLNRRRFPAGG